MDAIVYSMVGLFSLATLSWYICCLNTWSHDLPTSLPRAKARGTGTALPICFTC